MYKSFLHEYFREPLVYYLLQERDRKLLTSMRKYAVK